MADPRPLPFDWADPFAIEAQLSDEERLVRETARAYAQEKLQGSTMSATGSSPAKWSGSTAAIARR
jgi:hypothetical protein